MKDLAPETPAIANYTTGEVRMHACTLHTVLHTAQASLIAIASTLRHYIDVHMKA
jgi:hypothetical protein